MHTQPTRPSLIVMFCGPHRMNAWSPMYHRVDHAIGVARETRYPLLVTGDCFGGRAVAHFAERARAAGVRTYEAYDAGGYTETDARAVARLLGEHADLAAIDHLIVVTDDWHADRCKVMLRGEVGKLLPGRGFQLFDRSTDAGPMPPRQVRDNELSGLRDYLAGRPRHPRGEPFGKPAHPAEPQP